MDPVSHLALGRALAVLRATDPIGQATDQIGRATDKIGQDRTRSDDEGNRASPASSAAGAHDRRIMAAFLLGSLAPDVDAVLMPSGWDRYLTAHEHVTHSMAGTLACAVFVALGIVVITRSRRHALRLTLCAWAGSAVAHVGLDLVSGGTIRPFSPLLDTRWTLSLVAMADPILAAPLWLFFFSSLVWRRHAARLAHLAVAASLVLLATKGVSLAVASRLVAHHEAPLGPAVIEPEWGSFLRWAAFDRRGDLVRRWNVDVGRGTVILRLARSGPRESPEARASRTLDTVRNFHEIGELGFPEIRRHGPTTTVLWSDIRFCRESVCDLWFGGAFDAALRPIEQIVIVRDVKQTRPP